MIEEAVRFSIAGDEAVGIVHQAEGRLGVVVIVGGPQYRVGSHRQFVLLARALAAGGIPVFRFDYRGLGDSAGEARDFAGIGDDIRAAIDTFMAHADVTRVVLWGLCDAASAALMYAHTDARVAGLVLLNPWVHTSAAEAKLRLKTYYIGRLRSPEFWRKLRRLDLDLGDSLRSLWQYTRRALSGRAAPAESGLNYIERMRRGWVAFAGPTLIILSGDDLTAGEFRQLCADNSAWSRLIGTKSVNTVTLPDANHTFARAAWRARVEQESLAWVRQLAADDATAA